jgi:2-dehydro-3-deoxyphosphogluconate aldolase/(4S)-4-hydroxy-2-oxoglutarate aldolase
VSPLDQLRAQRVVAVVRASRLDQSEHLVEALARGGIGTVEFTFTTPGVEKAIARCAELGHSVGVGTVLDAGMATIALDAGASFLVTPCWVSDVIPLANARGVPVIMGALTPSEILRAHVSGADMVKVFPAATVGASHFTQLQGPFPSIELMASGGLNETNAADYLRAGAVAVAAGSSVVNEASVIGRDWKGVEDAARRFIEALKDLG